MTPSPSALPQILVKLARSSAVYIAELDQSRASYLNVCEAEVWSAIKYAYEAGLASALQETPDHPQKKDLAPNAPKEPSIEAVRSASPRLGVIDPARPECHLIDDECAMCSGEYCRTHGTDPCECDTSERHTQASSERLRAGYYDGHSAAQASIADLDATVLALTAQLAGQRESQKNLIDRIEQEMGAKYQRVVQEASGDISVNTAFSVALREEREESAEAIKELQADLLRLRRLLELYGTHADGCPAPYCATCGQAVGVADHAAECPSIIDRHDYETQACDCGFTAALSAPETPKQDAARSASPQQEDMDVLTIRVFREDDGRYAAEYDRPEGHEAGMGEYAATPIGALAELIATLIKVEEDVMVERAQGSSERLRADQHDVSSGPQADQEPR